MLSQQTWQSEHMSIFTKGNRLFQLGSKEPLRLRGLSLQDPLWQRLSPGPRLISHGTLGLEMARSWGANCVRIPFHPVTIRHAGGGDWMRGLESVTHELDWILLASKALGLFVVVDFHAIGFPALNTTFEFDEAPYENLYETSQFEIESFWRHIARQYHDHPSVAAFEIYNEAENEAAFGNQNDWDLHATWSETLINEIIRPLARETLVIVGGLHFGYDLEGAMTRPIRDSNVAYSSHPYPHHSQAKMWNRAFGEVADRHPVLLTEVGFAAEGFFSRDHHRGFRDWEIELRSYADAKQLSFFAWNFSASWEPALLRPKDSDDDSKNKRLETEFPFEPNEAGQFFKTWLESTSLASSSPNSSSE
jgi:endoglucanase